MTWKNYKFGFDYFAIKPPAVIFYYICSLTNSSVIQWKCAGSALFQDIVSSSSLAQTNYTLTQLSSSSHHYNATPALIRHFCISTCPVCIRFTSVRPVKALGISSLSAHFYANLFKKSSHNTCAFYFPCSRN